MEIDFPAAHSMDTEWFAVDRDGHVAYFNSGEAGAVPVPLHGWDCEKEIQILADSRHESRPIYQLDGFLKPFPFETGHECERYPDHDHGRMVLFLRNLTLVDPKRVTISRADRGFAVDFSELSAEQAKAIHASGACLGCFYAVMRGDTERAVGHGAFIYTHLAGESWMSAPYGRVIIPEKPLCIDVLPTWAANHLGRVRFPSVCFQEQGTIQPVELTPCVVQGGEAYLASDGKTIRANPGAEEAFRKSQESEPITDPRFVVELPPPTRT
jgi:hypothetical protein